MLNRDTDRRAQPIPAYRQRLDTITRHGCKKELGVPRLRGLETTGAMESNPAWWGRSGTKLMRPTRLLSIFLLAVISLSAVTVTMREYNQGRTGANTSETALTRS